MPKFIHEYGIDNKTGEVVAVIGSYNESHSSGADVKIDDCEFSAEGADFLSYKIGDSGKGWLTKRMPSEDKKDDHWLRVRALKEVKDITADPARSGKLRSVMEIFDELPSLKGTGIFVKESTVVPKNTEPEGSRRKAPPSPPPSI